MTGRATRAGALALMNIAGAAAFAWPFLLPGLIGRGQGHEVDAPLIFAGLLVCLGGLLFIELGRTALGPKTVALIGVLGAAMVALRLPGFIGGFSAMFIVVLTAGSSFGPAFGFVLGAVGTFASGMFVGGIGPWLPFQMVAVGWVGLGAGLLPKGSWPVRVGSLAAYGAFAAFAFGAVMNLWFWPFAAASGPVAWSPGQGVADNVGRYLTFYAATSFAWDAFGAAGNALIVAAAGRPLLACLDRAARRMRLDARAYSPPQSVTMEAEPAG